MSESKRPLRNYENPDVTRAERIRICLEEIGFDYEAQPKEFLESCNLCGAQAWTFIAHRDRFDLPISATSCRLCGLTILNPRLTSRAYGNFYNGVYRPMVSAFHGRRIDAQSIQEEQREYSRALATFLAPYLQNKSGATLLDVGGSTGIVSAYLMQQFGLRATVIDPAPSEVEAAKNLGLETINGFIEDWEPGERRFDMVGMFQTIDHLLDIRAALEKIRSLLNDGDFFIVDIVDFRAAYLRNNSVEAAVKLDHPYSLTEETTEAYLARAGFEVLRKNYATDHLHITYLCRVGAMQPDALPAPESTREFFREVRKIQNMLHPATL